MGLVLLACAYSLGWAQTPQPQPRIDVYCGSICQGGGGGTGGSNGGGPGQQTSMDAFDDGGVVYVRTLVGAGSVCPSSASNVTSRSDAVDRRIGAVAAYRLTPNSTRVSLGGMFTVIFADNGREIYPVTSNISSDPLGDAMPGSLILNDGVSRCSG